MPSKEDWLSTALHTVSRAGVVARSVQQRLDDVRSITKDDRSPVTVADFAVQAIVSMALHEIDAGAKLVGEEKADLLRRPDQEPVRAAVVEAVRQVHPQATEAAVLDAIDHGCHDATGDVYWVLDPIDGTKGFLRGEQYAIALALVEQGVVTMGVMGCPNLAADSGADPQQPDPAGVLYSARLGSGAFEHPGNDPERATRIHAATDDPQRRGGIRMCESVESSHTRQDAAAQVIEALGGAGAPVRIDSQCKYAVVARGQADVYLRLPTSKTYIEKIWDHAAGMLIAQEAGAIVSDVSGAALDFTHGRELSANRGIVCAAAGVHPRLIEAIETLGIAAPSA